MIEKYKISVITPSLNSSKYLEEAILSVLNQNYSNFEHIIVDGGSTDETINILQKYDHLIWVSEKDKGQSDAMNKGFAMSTGDIIVYLNADDYFLPDAFNSVIPSFENGSNFVVGNIRVIENDGKTWDNIPQTEFRNMLHWWIPSSFCYNPVGYFYLREVQENVPFNLDNHFVMDLEFLLQASLKYKFTKIEDYLGVFRYIPGTKTFSTNNYKYFLENQKYLQKFLEFTDEDYSNQYKLEFDKYMGTLKIRDNRVYGIISRLKGLFK